MAGCSLAGREACAKGPPSPTPPFGARTHGRSKSHYGHINIITELGPLVSHFIGTCKWEAGNMWVGTASGRLFPRVRAIELAMFGGVVPVSEELR